MAAAASAKQQSNVLIQKLLDAEEEAERIVKRARENRICKLKEAKISAEEELDLFKKKEDERFKREYEAVFGVEDSTEAELEVNTKKELQNVKNDFKNNKEKVVDWLLKQTVKIGLDIPEVQRRALKREVGTL